jgi:hypothetical protein
MCSDLPDYFGMKRKGFWELIIRRQKIKKGGKREMRTRFFGLAGYINGRSNRS